MKQSSQEKNKEFNQNLARNLSWLNDIFQEYKLNPIDKEKIILLLSKKNEKN